ncbi:MAG: TolB family protein, partial [Thermoanaerobaculia bacterium]
MPRPPILVAIIAAVLAGCSAAPPPVLEPADAVPVRGLAWSQAGDALRVVAPADGGGCALEVWRVDGTREASTPIPFCPDLVRTTRDGRLLLRRDDRSLFVDAGGVPMDAGAVVDADGQTSLALAEGRLQFGARSIELAGAVEDARLIAPDAAVASVRRPDGETLVRVGSDGTATDLAGPFPDIDSFAVSPDGVDVVFSAERDGGYDVGLVASAGTEGVRWIPADPLDERMVSWAPRGNKVTYAIGLPGGTVLRTVHIPTGFQLSVPLGPVDARELAWEPRAERFAVRIASAGAADRVDVLRYGGEQRRTVVAPTASFGADVQPLAGMPGAAVVAPEGLRYNERVPAVVWVVAADENAWDPVRARVYKNRRSGALVVPAGAAVTKSFWDAVEALGWVDPARVYVIAADDVQRIARAVPPSIEATFVTTAPGAPAAAQVRRVAAPLES